tara:strand:+ start:391 stop:1155 length:765 start_codon:yes stop_codon:yes gene_type:complete
MNYLGKSSFSISRFFQNVIASPKKSEADTFFLYWLCYVGFLVFVAFIMWHANVWWVIIKSDPTGLTIMIIFVFSFSTIWVGYRSLFFLRERAILDEWIASSELKNNNLIAPSGLKGFINDYFLSLLLKKKREDHERFHLTEILSERLNGVSDSAWWVNGIQIKLGLLGKVIGFSILAIQISEIQNFDASQSQNVLKTLTGGLGIALITTAVGLVANILLGVQLLKMDRCADELLADTLSFAENDLDSYLERKEL